jgi:excisionase family DNA binding protein
VNEPLLRRTRAGEPLSTQLLGRQGEVRARLEAVLAPNVVQLIEAFVVQAVDTELARHAPAGRNDRKWLTLKEAGEQLGVSADAVRMRIKRGRLESRRHGRRIYVSTSSIDRLE